MGSPDQDLRGPLAREWRGARSFAGMGWHTSAPGEAGSANGDERGAFFGAAAGQLWRVPLDLTDRGFRAIWRGGWFSQAIGAALSSG